MRILLLLLMFFCTAICCSGSDIDKLKTLDDVQAFLRKHEHNKKASYFDRPVEYIATRFSTIKFFKFDLNHDGLTDLLINGDYLFAVVDDGKGSYEYPFIDGAAFMQKKYVLINIDSAQERPHIIIQDHENFNNKKAIYDTLLLRQNRFVELNDHPAQSGISKISATTSGCFGTCPVFELTVASNGDALYNPIAYEKKKGNFRGKADTAALMKLFDLINYIRFRSLNDYYAVNWTDDQSIRVDVTYDDGTVKSIRDYGKVGTFGLRALYGRIFLLRKSIKWRKYKIPKPEKPVPDDD